MQMLKSSYDNICITWIQHRRHATLPCAWHDIYIKSADFSRPQDKLKRRNQSTKKEGNTEREIRTQTTFQFVSFLNISQPCQPSSQCSPVSVPTAGSHLWKFFQRSRHQVSPFICMPLQEEVGCRQRRMEDTTQTFHSRSKAWVPYDRPLCFCRWNRLRHEFNNTWVEQCGVTFNRWFLT